MRSFIAASTALALTIFASSALSQDCESYGLDFQNGGTYFQNNQSTDPFTALQEFEGCKNDTANNILVDPQGNQNQCSDSPLLPDDVPQLTTCSDWPKDKLYTGDWSLLVISNNGNGDPIAYERDFHLSVGPQQTTTVTPTVTVTDQPVVNVTSSTTLTDTSTIPSSTVTVSSVGKTVTQTPPIRTTVVTRGLLTQTVRVQTIQVSSTVTTVPASCSIKATRVKDPVAHILPTILGTLDNTVAGLINLDAGVIGKVVHSVSDVLGRRDSASLASAKFKRAILEGRHPSAELKRAYVQERSARLKKLQKRAPDEPTSTVTANSDIQTSTVLASTTVTQTVVDTITSSMTVTSGVATVGTGVMTITASASTRTIRVQVPIAVVSTTQTITHTYVQTPQSIFLFSHC